MPGLREGDRVNNYLLECRVGAGSFGEVWRARHHVFGTIVAIKIPTDTQYVRNLQREGIVVHGMQHQNIVRALDLDPYADPPYFIMEFIDGPSLKEAIDTYKKTFPISSAIAVMRGLLEGLATAHKTGLVHRDLKPANILLNHPLARLAEIDSSAVKVTDFGLGKVGGNLTQSIMQSGSLLTEEGKSISGTLAYMAPEQREGGDVDARSDLYACGIILFEMLTGERPQGGELPGSIRSGVPAYLDQVFQRCYTRWERRYASAREMLAALESRSTKVNVSVGVPNNNAGRCPQCKFAVERDDQFCIRCGRQLVESIPRCSGCRAFVRPGDQFCIFCGNDLRVLMG